MGIYQQVELLQMKVVVILCVFYYKFLFRENMRDWRKEKESSD